MTGSKSGGRPVGSSKVDAPGLLTKFEQLAVAHHHHRLPSKGLVPSREELADNLDVKSRTTVRRWCAADYFNLPWPPFALNQPAWLIDALPPFAMLYVNQALCELTGYARDELLHESSHLLRPRDPSAPEEVERLALAQRVKAGLEMGTITTYLLHKDGRQLTGLHIELRYGAASDAYFARIAQQLHLDEDLNVEHNHYLDPDGRWHDGLPPYVMTLAPESANRLAS